MLHSHVLPSDGGPPYACRMTSGRLGNFAEQVEVGYGRDGILLTPQ